MELPKAKSVEDAQRLARVWEKAERLFVDGNYYWYHCNGPIYGVYKRSYTVEADTAYVVNVTERTCTCADFQSHRDYCKHLLAILAERAKADEEKSLFDADEALCRRYEQEEGNSESAMGCDAHAEF